MFSREHGYGMAAYRHFKTTMSPSKNYVVNFQNIDGENWIHSRTTGGIQELIERPSTVEFRQPAATEEDDEQHRTHFYALLLKLAFQMAPEGANMFPNTGGWADWPMISDLIIMLPLPTESRLWFEQRLNRVEEALKFARRGGITPEDPYWEECNEDGSREYDEVINLRRVSEDSSDGSGSDEWTEPDQSHSTTSPVSDEEGEADMDFSD